MRILVLGGHLQVSDTHGTGMHLGTDRSSRDILTEALYPPGCGISDVKGASSDIEEFIKHFCKERPLHDFLESLRLPHNSTVTIKSEPFHFFDLDIRAPFKFGKTSVELQIALGFCTDPIQRDTSSVCLQQMQIINKRDKVVSGQGIGSRVFCSMIEGLSELGFKELFCIASRGKSINGYYTWARLGFNASIPYPLRQKTRESPIRTSSGAKIDTVQDLMETESGRAFWRKHGLTCRMSFDLTPDSGSWLILNAYKREKCIRSMQDIHHLSEKDTVS